MTAEILLKCQTNAKIYEHLILYSPEFVKVAIAKLVKANSMFKF